MPSLRSMIVEVLALWRDVSQKEIGAGAGIPAKQVSSQLKKPHLEDGIYRRLLAAVRGRRSHVAVVTACIEALDSLEEVGELTPEERDEIEEGVERAARLVRDVLVQAAWRSRRVPPDDRYPEPSDVEASRWHATTLYSLLQSIPPDHRISVVRVAREFQIWSLAELCCEESVAQVSRDLQRAGHLARLAQEIADRVRGPESWRNRLRGWVAGHPANVARVSGELKDARAALEAAKRLAAAGADPAGLLDPGRLLNLEGALCRAERRFDEALDLLDQAAAVGRRPELALVQKGFTLEVMGEYERAVETLLQAEPLIDPLADPRLFYMWRFDLAVTYTHLGRHAEAAELARRVREAAEAQGDENELIRVLWLEGRIAAGLGRREEALRLLDRARRHFAARKMWYDVALALLEVAVLLLEVGRAADVKALSLDLAQVFQANGIHREALAALRVFREEAGREMASAALARRLLDYLLRARHDRELRFVVRAAEERDGRV